MIQGDPGPITDKTDRNIRAARVHAVAVGGVLAQFKFWTGSCYLWPLFEKGVEPHWGAPFRDEGPTAWIRVYWLTGGICITRRMKEGE